MKQPKQSLGYTLISLHTTLFIVKRQTGSCEYQFLVCWTRAEIKPNLPFW